MAVWLLPRVMWKRLPWHLDSCPRSLAKTWSSVTRLRRFTITTYARCFLAVFSLSPLFLSFPCISLADPGSLGTVTKLTLVSRGRKSCWTQGVKALGDVCKASRFYIRQDLVGYLVPFKYVFYYHIVWVFGQHLSLCNTHVPGARESQKRVLGHLELELQTLWVAINFMSAGNQTHVSWKSSQCSWVLSLLPGPQDTWFITIIWYLAYIHCTLATDHSDPSRVPTPLLFVLPGGASDSGCQSCMADSCTHRGSSPYLLPLASNLFPPT